ncbi:60S ribosomal protein L14e [Ramicandelaber brevisporus]|nr:60S ribosomal protein L14e [Ramicandelaber brevisporus]
MSAKTSFKRSVEVGRVVLLNHGRDAGKLATIVEIIDHNRALIDGPTTGVARQEFSYKRMLLTPLVVKKLPRGTGAKALAKAFERDEIAAKWAKSGWAKKLEQRKVRASLTDFDRFKLMRLKKQRRAIVQRTVASLAKQQ